MLNAFYDAVHRVGDSNTVVTAETAPYGAKPGLVNMRPLLFWRTLMCVKDDKQLSPAKHCTKPKFDVLAHNPINTSGGPGASAARPRRRVDSGPAQPRRRAARGREGSQHPAARPPAGLGHGAVVGDEAARPGPREPGAEAQAQWYTKALYSLWKQGASMVLLLQVIDEPYDGTPGRLGNNYQSGVFFVDGTPKPAAAAMRFPLMAKRKSKKRVLLWGIAPKSGKVVIEQKGKRGKVATIKAREDNVFRKQVRLRGGGKLRASVGGEQSPYWKIG